MSKEVKQGKWKQKGGKYPGEGRPKRVFTPEEIVEIERMALVQCPYRTIAESLGLNEGDIRRRSDIVAIVSRKRAEGRQQLHSWQFKSAEKQPVMQIWLGKQHLEQTDKPVSDGASQHVTLNITADGKTVKADLVDTDGKKAIGGKE